LWWETLKAPYLLASCFAVSKEPFDFEIFSSFFSFPILNSDIYHLFLMPIIRRSIFDVKDLGTVQMQVCMAAQASSYERLRTEAIAEKTAQVKDLSMFLSNGDFS
jgi:hypothetical protein